MSRSTLGEVLRAVERFLDELSRKIRIERAYLFGSYAKGTWIKTSDVDLVVVSPDFRSMPFTKRLNTVNELQWKLGIRPFIEVIPLLPEELEVKLRESAVIRDASRYWVRQGSGRAPQREQRSYSGSPPVLRLWALVARGTR